MIQIKQDEGIAQNSTQTITNESTSITNYTEVGGEEYNKLKQV